MNVHESEIQSKTITGDFPVFQNSYKDVPSMYLLGAQFSLRPMTVPQYTWSHP